MLGAAVVFALFDSQHVAAARVREMLANATVSGTMSSRLARAAGLSGGTTGVVCASEQMDLRYID